MALTVGMLTRLSENPDPVFYDLAGDLRALVPQMRSVGIYNRKRAAAFLANVAQETDRLKTLEEYGDEAYYRSFLGDQWRFHGRGYMCNWDSIPGTVQEEEPQEEEEEVLWLPPRLR